MRISSAVPAPGAQPTGSHHPVPTRSGARWRVARWCWIGALLLATGALASGPQALDYSPEDGAVLDRPVRSLRIWFDQVPEVAAAEVTLTGPAGELEVAGLHTMGDDDLMARVVGRMPDGEYRATWRIGEGDDAVEGSWSFVVKRSAPAEAPKKPEEPPGPLAPR